LKQGKEGVLCRWFCDLGGRGIRFLVGGLRGFFGSRFFDSYFVSCDKRFAVEDSVSLQSVSFFSDTVSSRER